MEGHHSLNMEFGGHIALIQVSFLLCGACDLKLPVFWRPYFPDPSEFPPLRGMWPETARVLAAKLPWSEGVSSFAGHVTWNCPGSGGHIALIQGSFLLCGAYDLKMPGFWRPYCHDPREFPPPLFEGQSLLLLLLTGLSILFFLLLSFSLLQFDFDKIMIVVVGV